MRQITQTSRALELPAELLTLFPVEGGGEEGIDKSIDLFMSGH